ncbi:MAG: cytidylate kinase-like family protein [Chloroflexi bacterium]|nr:cytidylate kinase-like family protein [Chloroflexota bacterium]
MAHLFRVRGQTKEQPAKTPGATRLLPETSWAQEPLPSGVPPQNTVVVTISRQFGSGGSDIGKLVAQMSGLNYIDHEIIDEVAKRLGVDVQQVDRQDEQTAGLVGHILEAIRSSSPFNVDYRTLLGPEPAVAQSQELAYLHLTQRVILELATRGNAVIVGRGSQFLLHHAPRTLHIYVFAPLPYRIANIMQRFNIDHDEAVRLIERRDYEHDSYLRRYYGNNGHQPGHYHLLINTSLFSFELAAQLVSQALPVVKEIE